MKNQEVAKIFRDIAKILDFQGDNPFRIRAYERASQNIESIPEDIELLWKENRLTEISGIGKDLANKIGEIITTGTLSQYEELKKKVPPGILQMMEIPGLGPKTVKLIYEKLKIDNIDDLEKAAKNGKLHYLERIKEKTEENILRGIEIIRKGKERLPLYLALNTANRFIEELKKIVGFKEIEVAGSLRRRKDTIRDIDILVVSSNPQKVMDKFVNLDLVKEVLAKGETKSSVLAKESNIQVDLRVVEEDSFGSALMYFTGSKQFNIKVRQYAIKKGYKINEYGVFKGERKLVSKSEDEIFEFFKMQFIPPELREDRGEIELALEKALPHLVEMGQIKGDFHVHSIYSDGASSLEAIGEKAKDLGYQYIGISDHSQSLKVAHGVDKEKLYEKIDTIRKINRKLKTVTVLCGAEVDILSDGKLDYPDSILKELDIVIAAIHTGFKQSKEVITKRIISACKNKYVNIIAHPTGRLWGVREPYDVDLDEIFKVARDYRVALEINCYHQRLDLNDIDALRAKEAGIKLALGTDAHILEQLHLINLGVSLARRAWLGKDNLLNCMSLEELRKWLKK
ncbi:MAG: DNA polymerase/3'-5' exonuclease PolX [Candidatus Omnitrophica bacterium]|nr:DNA polymerase/3'-5' exonuclease PolX [Candidatus Omnitrophota bacterium]